MFIIAKHAPRQGGEFSKADDLFLIARSPSFSRSPFLLECDNETRLYSRIPAAAGLCDEQAHRRLVAVTDLHGYAFNYVSKVE